MGQAAVRRRAQRRRPQEQAARGNPHAARRAQPEEQREGQPSRRRGAAARRAAVRRRARQHRGHARRRHRPQRQARRSHRPGSKQPATPRSRATSWPGSIAKRPARKVSQVVEDHFRPEMRRMERALLLQILDTHWKEHLLAMDHLRSSVGLRGYAQIDPKVEYKREGMLLFDSMWTSVGNYVTDLIFKMEQLDEGFVGSTWVESAGDQGRSHAGQRNRTPAAGRHRRHRGRQENRTDPQPGTQSRPQRPLPLRQRQEIQTVLHEEELSSVRSSIHHADRCEDWSHEKTVVHCRDFAACYCSWSALLWWRVRELERSSIR